MHAHKPYKTRNHVDVGPRRHPRGKRWLRRGNGDRLGDHRPALRLNGGGRVHHEHEPRADTACLVCRWRTTSEGQITDKRGRVVGFRPYPWNWAP